MRKTLICLALLGLVFATQVVQQSVSDELTAELDSMVRQVKDEQNAHELVWSQQEADCQSEINFRTREINDGDNALNASQVHQSACEASRAVAGADITKAQGYQQSVNEIVAVLNAIREAELASYTTLVQDELDPALEALDGAYEILDDYQQNGVGFVQFTKGMNKVFRQMIKAKKTDQFAAVATALVQMKTTELSENGKEIVSRIRKLFRQLENDLRDARQHAVDVESERVATFEQYVSEYAAIFNQLQETVTRLTIYVAELNVCVANESAVQVSAQEKVAHNTEAYNHAVDFCLALRTQFENGSADRNAEVGLLVKIQRFVDEQTELFGDFGADGVDTFQEFKNNYESQRRANQQNFVQVKSKKLNKKFSCPTCKTFVQKKLRQ